MWGDSRIFSRDDNTSIWPPYQIPFQDFYNFSLPVGVNIVKMKTTRNTSMVLLSDGTLWSMGIDYSSAWSYPFKKININIPIKDFDIASYGAHDWTNAAAIDINGRLYTWGTNYFGEMAQNTNDGDYWLNILTPSDVNDNNATVTFTSGVKQVVMTNVCMQVLKTDGTLWSSGGNYYGQFGVGSTSGPNHILRRAHKNTSGSGEYFDLNNVDKIFKKSSQAYESSYILGSDNYVYVAGLNGNGQLGVGDTTDRTVFMKIPTFSNAVVDMAIYGAGNYISCMAYTSTNKVYTWGYNGYGQLGLGDTDYRHTPTEVTSLAGVIPAKLIKYGTDSAGNQSALIGTDGYLYIAGWRALVYPQQFSGAKDAVTTFGRVPIPNVVDAMALTSINNCIGWLIKDKNNRIYMICNDPGYYLTGPTNLQTRQPADITSWFV
jgi:alpha-tubulin suppressor-like RCC1 family protein